MNWLKENFEPEIKIKTNEDMKKIFGNSVEEFKKLFPNVKHLFLLQACKQKEYIFPEKIKKDMLDVSIEQLNNKYKSLIEDNELEQYRGGGELFKTIQSISHNKHFVTIIYNEYLKINWAHNNLIHRLDKINKYVGNNLIIIIREKLLDILWEENEIILWSEDGIYEEKIVSLIQEVGDNFSSELNANTEEKIYIEKIVNNISADILETLFDFEKTEENTVRMKKKNDSSKNHTK